MGRASLGPPAQGDVANVLLRAPRPRVALPLRATGTHLASSWQRTCSTLATSGATGRRERSSDDRAASARRPRERTVARAPRHRRAPAGRLDPRRRANGAAPRARARWISAAHQHRFADLVVDARVHPPAIPAMAKTLEGLGFRSRTSLRDGVGHRFVRGPVTIDVLAPEGAGERASRLGVAVGRRDDPDSKVSLTPRPVRLVEVSTGGRIGKVPRPDLAGALVMKALAAQADRTRGPARHLSDSFRSPSSPIPTRSATSSAPRTGSASGAPSPWPRTTTPRGAPSIPPSGPMPRSRSRS